MSKKISQKIVGYKVATEEQARKQRQRAKANIIQMHEKVSRPEAAGWQHLQDQDAQCLITPCT